MPFRSIALVAMPLLGMAIASPAFAFDASLSHAQVSQAVAGRPARGAEHKAWVHRQAIRAVRRQGSAVDHARRGRGGRRHRRHAARNAALPQLSGELPERAPVKKGGEQDRLQARRHHPLHRLRACPLGQAQGPGLPEAVLRTSASPRREARRCSRPAAPPSARPGTSSTSPARSACSGGWGPISSASRWPI